MRNEKLSGTKHLVYACFHVIMHIRATESVEAAESWVLSQVQKQPHQEAVLCRAAFHALRREHPEIALRFAERAISKDADDTFIWAVATQYRNYGNIRRAAKLFQIYTDHSKEEIRFNPLHMLRGQEELLEHGFPMPSERLELAISERDARGIIYLMHNALPYTSSGYATRSHGLLKALTELQWPVYPVTRFGFPTDLSNLGMQVVPEKEEVDGLTYIHLPTRSHGYGKVPLNQYLHAYQGALLKKTRELKPRILHAASNWMNGVAANSVGRMLGLPTVYEVRGLWEVTLDARRKDWKESELFQLMRQMEIDAASQADRVVTITDGLRSELIERGVDERKIRVVPNGVDPRRFVSRDRDHELEKRFGYQDKIVIAFIGSILDYEGLDILLNAVAKLRGKGDDTMRVLIVGDGMTLDEIKKLSRDLSLNRIVRFTGRVPHSEVERYYSLADIMPYPRKGYEVCEIVSPMKIFESMALGKTVVVSDVAALREIVQDGVTGMQHRKDDHESLSHVLEILAKNPVMRRRLGDSAAEWVRRERDWRVLAAKLGELYEELADRHAARSPS